MKSFLLFVCSFLLVIAFTSGAPGQSQKRDKPSQTAAPSAADGQQIDVKPDRFSGATKITLKPIYLFKKSNQKLAMSLEIKVDPKSSDDDIAFVNFISYSEYPMNFGDRELHCLIDGGAGQCDGEAQTGEGPPKHQAPALMRAASHSRSALASRGETSG